MKRSGRGLIDKSECRYISHSSYLRKEAEEPPAMKPISACVNTNLKNFNVDFVPGHQHHQHGMGHSHGGHSHGSGKKFLLNGSRTVFEQRPSGAPVYKPGAVKTFTENDLRKL
jgi:hypothetical protein